MADKPTPAIVKQGNALAAASQTDAGQVILTEMKAFMASLIERALSSPLPDERNRVLDQVNGIAGFLTLANEKVKVSRGAAAQIMARVASQLQATQAGEE